MQKFVDNYISSALRVLSTVITLFIALVLILTYIISTPSFTHYENSIFHNGFMDLAKCDLANSEPVSLNGEWDYFPGIFFEAQQHASISITNFQKIQLPIGKISDATGTASYRAYIKTPFTMGTSLILYIPSPKSNVNVFMNGIAQPSAPINTSWINYSQYNSIFYLNRVDTALEKQEIIISVNNNPTDTGIYKRPIIISTLRNVMTLMFLNVGNSMLVCGLLILIMISGYIFMWFLPGHKVITFITLFDSVIMLRLLFGMPEVVAFFENVFPTFIFSDGFCLAMQIFFLMLAGIMGCRLSHHIFDPEGKAPKILTIPPLIFFSIFAIIFPFNIELFDKIGVPLILCAYLYTFIGISWQLCIILKAKPTGYYILQAVKTVYVGILILYDLVMFNSSLNVMSMIYFYCIFFLIHLGIRLYDNKIIYKNFEKLNQSLESLVVQRTHELSETNKILNELTIRDPLTKAFNRLYFERVAERCILEYKEKGSLHLCLFDLDHFKLINDTFGHDAGDEHLKFVVSTALDTLDEKSMFSRIGGEEFTILFVGYSDDMVMKNVERLRQALEDSIGENIPRTTASFGVTKYQPKITLREFLKSADKCLYKAKQTGRNKIVSNF